MITRYIRIVNNTVNTEDLGYRFDSFTIQLFSVLPAWITPSYYVSGFLSHLTVSPTITGTFTYYFTEGGSPSIADYEFIIEVVDSLTDSIETCSNSNTKCIVWITREGGRASCNFNQRKDFGGIVGQSQTFDNGGAIKYLTRGKVFSSVTVYKTGVTNTEIDLIESLRNSIQAWEYNSDTDVSTPILLDSDSYDKYSTKNKLSEIKLKYRIATYKQVQRQ